MRELVSNARRGYKLKRRYPCHVRDIDDKFRIDVTLDKTRTIAVSDNGIV